MYITFINKDILMYITFINKDILMYITYITFKMERAKLEEFNHWWIAKKVDPELALPFKRDVSKEMSKYIDKRFILSLTGLRRTGKTTIIYQLIKELTARGISPERILFFSFDEETAKIDDVIESYKELQKKDFREERIYILFDEIQKCSGWENELKKYYDLYPKMKFVISGSESLFIKKKTKETLAGRVFEFVLTPFTFREYLKLNNIKEEDIKYETKIMPLFIKFAEKGGFPETFSFESKKEFKEYIKSIVIDQIIYKDIPRIFKIEDPEFLRVLLELISTNPGMYIDYQSLSRQFEKDRRIIKNYILYLKESFLINLLGNYRKGSITTLRKKKRAYPSDASFIYAYKSGIDEAFFAKIVETIAVNHIKASTFWKKGNEVDIIHNDVPIEIKYQEQINSEDFKGIREFMKKFNVKRGILVTKKEEKTLDFEEGQIKLIPMWKWLLEKGN